MVIVAIGVLIALLLPAIQGAVRTANNAAVTSEINAMAQALASFQAKYGDYPPSRMLLCENGAWNTQDTTPLAGPKQADITYGQLAQRSISYMRKFWPRVTTTTDITNPIFKSTSNVWYDFNGNGKMDSPYVLEGHECLVWFLGGIPTTGGVSGFSKNPVNPFVADSLAPNRTRAFFEFKANRLALDTQATSNPLRQLAQIPAYQDSLRTGRFYAYFSAYGGGAYDPNDVNFDVAGDPQTEMDANGVFPLTLAFLTKFPVVGNSSNGTNSSVAVSASPNPYCTTSSVGASTSAALGGSVSFQNPNSFQILSAGGDGFFGVGGIVNTNATPSLAPDSGVYPNSPGTSGGVYDSTDPTLRVTEQDNLSNFTRGVLQ
jgi:general secretion pathway protein G